VANCSVASLHARWIGINGVEDITFNYGPADGNPIHPLTVGAENVDGIVGTNYFAHGVGTVPVEGDILRVITTTSPDPAAVPLPGAIVIWAGIFGAAGVLRRGRCVSADR
jgi:hypothetical protein